jgi:TolB-like protein/DNA-binding SARP family transcriptional activator
MVSLKLLGGASVFDDGEPLHGAVVQRHRLALLALLACSRPAGVSRDKLAALLWPESDAERARNSLKQAVHVIRRALGPEAVLSAGDELRLDPSAVWCDVIAFRRAVDAGDREGAVSHYAGPFLDGFFLGGSREFEEWVESERTLLRDAFQVCLEGLAEASISANDTAGAVRWWRRLSAESPGNSRVALRLMHALAAAGDRAGAIRHGQQHAAFLDAEFGAAPDPDVTTLLERLRDTPLPRGPVDGGLGASVGDSPAPPSREPVPSGPDQPLPAGDFRPAPVPDSRAPGGSAEGGSAGPRPRRFPVLGTGLLLAVPAALLVLASLPWRSDGPPGEPGLVVLPFVDLGGLATDAYFSDGMTEELIHTLSQMEGLRVIARTSAFQFRGQSPDVRSVGERLGVELVLEGSVRRSGDRVRITAQLVSTDDGSHLWSRTYDRSLGDVLAVQEEIARAIAGALRLRLAGTPSLVDRHSENQEAYHLYLKGLHALNQRTPERARQALDFFQQALALDPGYALAHAGIAQAHIGLVDMAGVPPDVAIPMARAAAEEALRWDAGLADVHALLGWMYTDEWRWEEAAEAFARAFELDPGEPEAYLRYSLLLDNMGRFDEALEATLHALQLDPLSATAHYNVIGSYLHLARFEEAITGAERMIELHPMLSLGYDALGWALVDAGRPAEAVGPLERAVSIGEGRWLALSNLGRAYAGVGRLEDARAVLARLERDWSRVGMGHFAMAAVHLALDQRDEALRSLEQVYALKYAKLPHVRQWTAFEPLYGDPDFSRIVRAAGFEPPGPVR